MKYQQPTFTTPVSNGKLTQEEYEVAVGLRCPCCLSKNKKHFNANQHGICWSDSPTEHHPWHDKQ